MNAGKSFVTITGKNEIFIENFTRLIDYNEDKIIIQNKEYKIFITGKKLKIEYFNADDMFIRGMISNIEYL